MTRSPCASSWSTSDPRSTRSPARSRRRRTLHGPVRRRPGRARVGAAAAPTPGTARCVAVTAGPHARRRASCATRSAAGADRAVRVDLDPTSARATIVAAALAAGVSADATSSAAATISLDRGSGSVPAFLAAQLGAAQALGPGGRRRSTPRPGVVTATRRLDGGRRERLRGRRPGRALGRGGDRRLRRARSAAGWRRGERPSTCRPRPAASTPAGLPHGAPARTGPAPGCSPRRVRTLDARDRILALTGASWRPRRRPHVHAEHGRGRRRAASSSSARVRGGTVG